MTQEEVNQAPVNEESTAGGDQNSTETSPQSTPDNVVTAQEAGAPPAPEPAPEATAAGAVQATESGFEPKIIGFLCNWCSYAGADLCGVSRYQYPTNIRIIRVMCSTRIDPYLIISIFKAGADGIFVGGCHIGDCHYITGNYHTEKKMALTKRLLKESGFEPKRLRLEWVSASEGERFSKIITEFTNEIKSVGPSPLSGPTPDQRLLENLESAEHAALEFRLRALVGKEYKITTEGNVYGEVKTEEEWNEMFDLAIKNEYIRNKILKLTGKQPYSVIDLSKELGEPTDKVLEHIVYLRRNNQVAMDSIEGTTPKYVSLLEGGK